MDIPIWLAPYIPTKCECGGTIYNNPDLTRRACTNPSCRNHLAYKIVDLAKYFGVKGMGPASAKELVMAHQLTYHLDALQYLVNGKPTVSLWEVAHLAMVEGHDKDMRQFCQGYASFEDVFASNQQFPFWFQMMKDTLTKAEGYFNVKPPLSKTVLNVMMTGELHGYPSRSMFLDKLNKKYGALVQFVDVGVRKTNVWCLIREEDAAFHNKTKIAIERKIPIFTPKQLENAMEIYVKQKLGGAPNEDR